MWGLIPLVNYGLVDFDGGTWFIEGRVSQFFTRTAKSPFNVVGHHRRGVLNFLLVRRG